MNTETRERFDERYYRKPWMTDDQWACTQMVADLQGGFHHVTNEFKRCGSGIETSVQSRLATFDFDDLTRLVLLAHDRCIRVQVCSSGPGMVKLQLHRRHKRDGSMTERHPTIEQAIAVHRKYYPAPSEDKP